LLHNRLDSQAGKWLGRNTAGNADKAVLDADQRADIPMWQIAK
jgi:hypothetical protein